jgi:hypothetical protein
MSLLLRLLLALAASMALPLSALAAETASGPSAASVNEEHTYFVGEAGAWVHNTSGCGPAVSAGRALKQLGFDKAARRDFFSRGEGLLSFDDGATEIFGFATRSAGKLNVGVVRIESADPVFALGYLGSFQSRALALARGTGAEQLTVFGAVVRNDSLGKAMLKRGFTPGSVPYPSVMGQGSYPALVKSFFLP